MNGDASLLARLPPQQSNRSRHRTWSFHHSCQDASFACCAEGHELPSKWKVAKQMIGRRLSQEEAKRLLAKFA
jgi:hypothetical protein